MAHVLWTGQRERRRRSLQNKELQIAGYVKDALQVPDGEIVMSWRHEPCTYIVCRAGRMARDRSIGG